VDYQKRDNMKSTGYVRWQEGDTWLGYLEEFPDYVTQGESLTELEENLRDIYEDLTSGKIPCVRRRAAA
jgi:predicted RNase H-like HicB family nuclease